MVGLGRGVPSRLTDEASKLDRRSTLVRKVRPVLTVASVRRRDGTARRRRVASVIDEVVRAGARRMLAEALQAEVDAYIARFAEDRDENGRRLVARNGCHEPPAVTTCAGVTQVHAPRVNDRRARPGYR